MNNNSFNRNVHGSTFMVIKCSYRSTYKSSAESRRGDEVPSRVCCFSTVPFPAKCTNWHSAGSSVWKLPD